MIAIGNVGAAITSKIEFEKKCITELFHLFFVCLLLPSAAGIVNQGCFLENINNEFLHKIKSSNYVSAAFNLHVLHYNVSYIKCICRILNTILLQVYFHVHRTIASYLYLNSIKNVVTKSSATVTKRSIYIVSKMLRHR